MSHYLARSRTVAPIDLVWSILIDGRHWPDWSRSLDELVEKDSVAISPDGRDEVGAVRAFRTGRVVTAERLTRLEAPRHLVYEGVFNPALRNYEAEIRLDPATGGGTDIRWSGTYRMRPGLGWFMPLVLPRTMQALADDLAARATARANRG